MTQTRDLIKKMAEFFKSEEYFEKGEDARLELSPEDVRCMNRLIHTVNLVNSSSENPNKWIPCSERLPEDLEPVNITWVNHEPEPYYHDIKDKNYVATGIHYKGQWYWYSTTCADYLGEYGSNEVDKVDDAIEIVAWMPLPTPLNKSEIPTVAEGSEE